MKRVLTIVGTIAVAAGSIGLSTTADAGIGTPVAPVRVIVNAAGSQASNVAAYPPSFIVDGGVTITPSCTPDGPVDNGFSSSIEYTCALAAGSSYELVLPDPPTPFEVTRLCQPSGDATIDLTVDPTTTIEGGYFCVAAVIAPTIVLDKILPGSESGPLAETDFTLEVFPSAGGEAVGSDTDPSADVCEEVADIDTRCGYVEVDPGTYVVGEQAEYGYFPLLVECSSDPFGEDDDDPIIIGPPPERIDSTDAEVTVTPVTDDMFSYFAGCSIGNIYVESQLDVFKTVTNDDGGTATPGDWTVELFDDEGAMVTSVACAADGTCLSDTFPIGQYTVGEVGPDGYDSTVSRTVTTETFPVEALPDEDATFDLDILTQVDITIASDDQPTTTTTIAESTTTAGPTTTAGLQTTTTAFDAGAGTLPATGSSQRNASIALLAFGLVLFGAAAVLATRRR